jgi:predicted DCC family thiol-disulfide oxidoreductase YuxK
MKKKILYDCDCRLCSASVRFVRRHDRKEKFFFIPLQSDEAKKLLSARGLGGESDTLVLIDGVQVQMKSDAVLSIVKELDGIWRFGTVLRFLPKGLRDGCYDLVAKYRYRFLGRKGSCDLPQR